MAQLLNLAMAAKMAGVRRLDVQALIREGKLHTFEGMIRVEELLRVYPRCKLENTEMIDTVNMHKKNAVAKMNRMEDDPETLRRHICDLKNKLINEQKKNLEYADRVFYLQSKLENVNQQLVLSLQHKLQEMQSQCHTMNKSTLETDLKWLSHEIEKNTVQ
jgi:CDP-4-dehydro-6-deoxyglucose reductase, E3